MATAADFTTRARDEIYSLYVSYQELKTRIDNLSDEVTAAGGAAGLYGQGGVDFPAQADGFEYSDMVAAFTNIQALIGEPTTEQKNTLIRCRR